MRMKIQYPVAIFTPRLPLMFAYSYPLKYCTESFLIMHKSMFEPDPRSLNTPAAIPSRTNFFPSSSVNSGVQRAVKSFMLKNIQKYTMFINLFSSKQHTINYYKIKYLQTQTLRPNFRNP